MKPGDKVIYIGPEFKPMGLIPGSDHIVQKMTACKCQKEWVHWGLVIPEVTESWCLDCNQMLQMGTGEMYAKAEFFRKLDDGFADHLISQIPEKDPDSRAEAERLMDAVWKMAGGHPPPFHPNCRCQIYSSQWPLQLKPIK